MAQNVKRRLMGAAAAITTLVFVVGAGHKF